MAHGKLKEFLDMNNPIKIEFEVTSEASQADEQIAVRLTSSIKSALLDRFYSNPPQAGVVFSGKIDSVSPVIKKTPTKEGWVIAEVSLQLDPDLYDCKFIITKR